jgi:helicase
MKIPLSAGEQVRMISGAAAPQVDQANAMFVRSYFASHFGGEEASTALFEREVDAAIFGLETVGFDLNRRLVLGDPTLEGAKPWEALLWPAFRIRRALLVPHEGRALSPESLESIYHEALDGIVANRLPELKYQLRLVDFEPDGSGLRWDHRLQFELRKALLLLVRRAPANADIVRTNRILSALREGQTDGELSLTTIVDPNNRQRAAARAMALYYVARAIELTGQLISGDQVKVQNRPLSPQGVKTENDRLLSASREILRGHDSSLLLEVPRINQALNALVDTSVYAVRLPPSVREFVGGLATRKDKPVLEFWWAQRQAIDSRLLDQTRTAVVVSLPTSAGKTLLAELAIVQATHEEPTKRIVYLAPTRALVTQVTLGLRRDFANLGISVQSASSGFDLDPIERQILAAPYNVLVTTPEKLDLLVRSDHEAVRELSLVVVDEAHNIGGGLRGARLELLLSTLRRERSGCRFVLLTPFASNAADVARWLGGDSGTPILVDWKPNDRIVGAFQAGGSRKGSRPLTYTTLESAHSDCPKGLPINLGFSAEVPMITKKALSVVAASRLADALGGGVLVLAASRKDAEHRAASIADALGARAADRDVDLVARYILTETGGDHPLPGLLQRGVAFHHAGLSTECRYLVERLVERGRIKVVCATTTLAQGVHFPLSTAVIESLNRRGLVGHRWVTTQIDPQEFWNVVGRVGRTFEDSFGSVFFIACDDEDVEVAQEFLRKDATTIQSAIAEMMQALVAQPPSFSIGMVERHLPLSAFLQYILHAIAVGGEGAVSVDALESLIRNSFAFLQAEQQGEGVSDALLRWAKAYVELVSAQKGRALKSFAEVADETGFSSPSVDRILNEWTDQAHQGEWTSDQLFPVSGGSSEVLTKAMDTLGRIPEVSLGTYDVPKFSPERIARIVGDWVNGISIWEIAKREYDGDVIECNRHIYSQITSVVPWGLRAIEQVGFRGIPQVDWDALGSLQAMVLHGVRSQHAIGLRLLGVPRFAAEGLATLASKQQVRIPELKNWLDRADSGQWELALPKESKITGDECRRVWRVLSGNIPWEGLVDSA